MNNIKKLGLLKYRILDQINLKMLKEMAEVSTRLLSSIEITVIKKGPLQLEKGKHSVHLKNEGISGEL